MTETKSALKKSRENLKNIIFPLEVETFLLVFKRSKHIKFLVWRNLKIVHEIKKNLNVKESSIDNLKIKIICAGKYIIVESISKTKVFSTMKKKNFYYKQVKTI